MKFFAPIVVGVIAFFSAQVDANGVCYDPDHTSGKSDTTVQADMEAIAGAGFSSVRTYISKFGNTEMGPIIAAAGLTAVLGVPYPQSDYQDQMEAAISAANSGGVYAIMVGNENLAGASSVPSGMIDVINQIKARVSVKVGTVQRNTEVIGYTSISGWSDLVSACDVLGVNVHPFFNPGTTADGAIDVVDTQWQTMMSNFGDKLLLTETGWPSSGSVSGNTGSLSGEQTFYSAYQQWSSGLSEKFYFQFFDTPSKSESYEQTFGLYTSDSQSKFTMSQQQSSTTTSTSTQQQTTSAPTTSAPTTEAPSTQQPSTSAPTTSAPTTEAPSTSAPTATPTPETYQSSASSETTSGSSETTSGSSETNTTSSLSSTSSFGSSGSSVQQGSASLSSSSHDVEVSSSSESSTFSSTEQEERSASSNSKQTSETTQSTAAISSIGKSAESQQTSSNGDDSTQQANTQSEASSSGGMVGLAVGGGACAMLVAFGFIYQARKRAQEMEDDEKELDQHFSTITPVENICAL